MPERSYATADLLKEAVDGVLDGHVERLAHSTISLRCDAEEERRELAFPAGDGHPEAER